MENYAVNLRNKVKKWTGIPVSVGIAKTKVLAKIANHIAKKHKKSGAFILDNQEIIEKALKFTAVEDIWGIGKNYAKKLKEYGVNTAYDLTCVEESWIKKKFSVVVLKIAQEKNWIVISDECYERLVFDQENTISQKLANDNNLKTEIITCMSMSKTYAMTGWRIGYAFGNIDNIKAMTKIQGQATTCANSIGQAASIEELVGDQNAVSKNIEILKERRDNCLLYTSPRTRDS